MSTKADWVDPRATAMRALDELGIDEFCDRIINGDSQTKIAQTVGVGIASIAKWLALDPERSARARDAMQSGADTHAEKAEIVLMDKTMDVARARELASHYRWLARVRNPKQYGDKLEIDQTTKVTNASDSELDAQMQAINKKLSELDAAAKAPLAAPGGDDA